MSRLAGCLFAVVALALFAVSPAHATPPIIVHGKFSLQGFRTGQVRFLRAIPTQVGFYAEPTAANLLPLEAGFRYGRNFAVVTRGRTVFGSNGRTTLLQRNGDGTLTVIDLGRSR